MGFPAFGVLCKVHLTWKRASYIQLERKVPLKLLIICNHHVTHQHAVHLGVPLTRVFHCPACNIKDVPSPLQVVHEHRLSDSAVVKSLDVRRIADCL